MNLPIFVKKEDSTIDIFIDFWRKFYEPDRYRDQIYFDNLKPISELTVDNVQELFNWKNGMRIAPKKQESIDKLKADLTNIKNRFEKSGNLDDDFKKIYTYGYNFFKSGHIWNLFFLHILKYKTCPIADKYAYRAFNLIINGKNEIPDNWESWEFYIEYKNFFNKIALDTNRSEVKERKEIDEAFWGFGKFSENYPGIIGDSME